MQTVSNPTPKYKAALCIRAKALPPMGDVGLAGMFAGAWDGHLIAAGGSNFPGDPPWAGGKKTWYSDVYVSSDGPWKRVGALDAPAAMGASVSTPRGVFCIGGGDEHAITGNTFFLRLVNDKIAIDPAPSLPRAVMACSAAVVGNRVFVVGGHDRLDPLAEGPVANIWSIDLDNLERGWNAETPMPGAPRWLAVTGSDGSSLYVFSGLTKADEKTIHCTADVWRYIPAAEGSGTWQRLTDLPRANAAIPAPVPFIDGRFILLGGGVDDSNFPYPPELRPAFPATVIAYDPIEGTADTIGVIPAAPVVAPIVPWRDGFVIISGEVRTRTGVRTPAVWHYSIAKK